MFHANYCPPRDLETHQFYLVERVKTIQQQNIFLGIIKTRQGTQAYEENV